ncbi:MAG: hypothetical protein EBS85_00195 [Micrococcales bacterium]|nr:hypothetical protein [Actinomycetota bacterium]NCA07139.1 hypothetical protein [Micrococcales bacterium]
MTAFNQECDFSISEVNWSA